MADGTQVPIVPEELPGNRRRIRSSATTAGFTLSAAGIAPAVAWGVAGFPQPVPDQVVLILSAGVVVLIHAVYNFAQKRSWI